MIYLKLRQEQWPVNYKRVERFYQKAKLQVRRRKRKRVLLGERQPLLRPEVANQRAISGYGVARVGNGRSRETAAAFFKQLPAGIAEQIRAVAVDMTTAYELEIRANYPSAEIVFDLFHVVAKYGAKSSTGFVSIRPTSCGTINRPPSNQVQSLAATAQPQEPGSGASGAAERVARGESTAAHHLPHA